MKELERAAQAAVAAASAAPPVAEVEARAGRMRRGRVLRVGASAVVVVLVVVVGSMTVLASSDDGRTVDTASEVDGEPVRLSVVFPEGASEERERAVLDARLAGLGAPFTVAGEWPTLTVTVGGFTDDEVAWVVGTPGELAVVVVDPGDLRCPSAAGSAVAIQDDIEELDERLEELERRIAEAGGASSASASELVLERASLLQEQADLKAQIRDLSRDAARSTGARLPGWPPRGASCAEAIAAAEAEGSARVERIRLSPADAPHVDTAGPAGTVVIDVGGTPLSDAAGDEGALLFVDARPVGASGPVAEGGDPARFTVDVEGRAARLLAAVIAGGYEVPPALTLDRRPDSPAAVPSGGAPATDTSATAADEVVSPDGPWDLHATVTVGSVPGAAAALDPVRVISQRLSTVAAGPSRVTLTAGGTVEVHASGLTAEELRALLEPSEGLVVPLPRDSSGADEEVGPEGSVLGPDALCGDPGPWPSGQAATSCSDATAEHVGDGSLLYPAPFTAEVVDGGVAVEVSPDVRALFTAVSSVLLDGRRLSPPTERDATHVLFPGYSGREALMLVALLGSGPVDVVDVVIG